MSDSPLCILDTSLRSSLGPAIEVDRTATRDGLVTLLGHRLALGPDTAGTRVTLRIEGGLIHAIAGNHVIKTQPNPLNSNDNGRLTRVRRATTQLPPPPPSGPQRVHRRVPTDGVVMVAGQRLRVGRTHAGTIVTVKLAVEMHPHQLVYNPPSLERLLDVVDSAAIGVEMDPSHLFWQGIDPIDVIRRFGDRIFIAAAKDTLIHEENLRRNGFLNNLWRRHSGPGAIRLGGKFALNYPPTEPSYEFVAIGKGHDVGFWTDWLRALHDVNPSIAVNIEHEDAELGPIDGLDVALGNLRKAAAQAGIELESS